MKKQIFSMMLALLLCLSQLPISVAAAETVSSGDAISLMSTVSAGDGISAGDAIPAEEGSSSEDIVILYTNDVHTYINKDITYSKVAALKDSYENVLLLDAGDHIQGTAYGSMDKGKTIIGLMNAAGYDAATLGNHEFDYGMNGCMNAIAWADFSYVSCNFKHESNGVMGETVLDPYKVFEVAGEKIAVIGITTPETFTSSTPAYFQDGSGNYIYGIAGGDDGTELYAAVQEAINAASAEADVVIGVGHLGLDLATAPWRSVDVIANTTGLDAFIDGHSHNTVEMQEVTDKGGNTVILTQTGEYFNAVGKMTISAEGIVTELLTAEDLTGITPDASVKNVEDAWIGELDAHLKTKIGYAEVVFDNIDGEGNRLVRFRETNSGDFTADALYYLFDSMGMDVDLAIMNGGGVRNAAITGDITYETCKQIHSFGNVACLQTVTGQQLLDALEWGAQHVGISENGGFLQVSGVTYEIETTVPSTVQKDEKSVWTGGPTGEYRVRNVKIYNKETNTWDALDLGAKYNMAGYNYILRDLGNGYAMFGDAVNVLDYVMEDYMVLATYVQGFEGGIIKADNSPLAKKYPGFKVDYSTINGSGRIAVTTTVKEYPIWVGGVQITEENAGDILGDGGSAVYDEATNTLTLNDFTYTGEGYKYSGIYAERALNMILKGENKITCSGYYGIRVKEAALTIRGDGSLDVEGSDYGMYTSLYDVGALTIGENVTIHAKSGDVLSGSSYGIRADGALTIKENASVTAEAGYGPTRSCGIYAYTTFDISDNATVTAIGGASPDDREEIDSYGIRTTYMTISGGTLKTSGDKAKYASCGIYTQTFDVTGGSVTAEAAAVTEGPSIGIQAAKSVTVSGGTVNAVSGDASANADVSCAIQTGGDFTISGGEVKAQSGVGGNTVGIEADRMIVTGGAVTATAADSVLLQEDEFAYSWGIQALNEFRIEGGTVEAIGGDAVNYSYGIQTTGEAYIGKGFVEAEAGSAAKSVGFWAFGAVTVEGAQLFVIGGDAVSDNAAYSMGLCSYGGLDIDFGSYVQVNGGKAVGKNAYSSGIEVYDNNVQVYSGHLLAAAGQAIGTVKAGSVGIYLVNGGLYTYENKANVTMSGGLAEVTGSEEEAYAYSNGICVGSGDVTFHAGTIVINAGSASGVHRDNHAVYIVSGEDEYGRIGGYLSFYCDEVTSNVGGHGTPGLIGTTVTINGTVLADMGIEIDDTLRIRIPEAGTIKEMTDANGSYYTIVESDGETVAQRSKIDPLTYVVRIKAKYSMAVPVPAGKTINEFYCEIFDIEDFSERLDTEKEGYDFKGWYTDEACTAGNEFDFNTQVTADVTLYGKWVEKAKPDTGGSDSGNTTQPNGSNTQGTISQPINSSTPSNNVPLTSDSNVIWPWVMMLLISGVVIVILSRKMKSVE